MSNNDDKRQISVRVTFTVKFDLDSHEFANCYDDKKTQYYDSLCDCDRDEQGLPHIDITEDDFNLPGQLRCDMINDIKDRIEDVELPEIEENKMTCPGCDRELHEDNFDEEDPHGDNPDNYCNDCVEQLEEQAAVLKARRAKAILLSKPLPITVDKLADSFGTFMNSQWIA